MAFVSLDQNNIGSGKPLLASDLQIIKDNFDYLNAMTDPGFSGVLNGSFEFDSDGDGEPDGWTVNLYAGGAGAIVDGATEQDFGGKAYRFTHPGGASNGGGELISDFIEISESVSPVIEFTYYSNAALRVQLVAEYYDKDQSAVSDETIFTTDASTAAFTRKVLFGIPPASARYMKIKLVGGSTALSTAGQVTFDNVRCNPFPREIEGEDFQISEGNTTNTSYASLGSVNIRIPKGFTYAYIPAEMYVKVAVGTDENGYGYTKYLIGGSVSSNELLAYMAVPGSPSTPTGGYRAYNYGVLEVDISAQSGSSVACALQGKVATDTSATVTVYGAKVVKGITFKRK